MISSAATASVRTLAPGGVLVYCACSLQPQEGAGVVDHVISEGARARRSAISPAELPDLVEALTPQGDVRTLPYHLADRGGIDGFYACRLLKL